MKNITNRLLSLQKDRSRRSFASLLGVAEGTLRAYEAGTTSPNIQTLERVCKKLRISQRWLLLGEGPVYTEEESEEFVQVKPSDKTIQRLEAKVADLEKQLMESKDEIIRAYRLATAHMQPDTDTLQKPKNRTIEPLPLKQTHLSTRADEKS